MKIWTDCIWVGCWWVIINDQNKILLLKRSKNAKNEKGFRTNPGWLVAFWETIIDAIKREVMEETWLVVENVKFLSYTDHIISQEWQHWVSIVHLMKVVSWVPRIMEIDKFDDIGWFDLKALPMPISPATLNPINVYKNE